MDAQIMKISSRGCRNGAFGKASFCLGDTRHFHHLRRFPGSEEQNPLFSWIECKIRIFADLRQNHLFSIGDENTVSKRLFRQPRSSESTIRFSWSGILKVSGQFNGARHTWGVLKLTCDFASLNY